MPNYPYPTLTERIPLEDALWRIADKYGLSAEKLQGYAAEDTVGGYHHDASERTADHGIWGVEGQVVYALIRALRPRHVLEVGTGWGNSIRHIVAALEVNGVGKLTTFDNSDNLELPAPDAAVVIRRMNEDLFDFNYNGRPKYDFVFEDAGPHSEKSVGHVWQEFIKYGKKGGVIVSHDSEHFRTGEGVRAGIETVTDDYLSVAIHPADCGLAIGRKE